MCYNRKMCMICKYGIVGDMCKNKNTTYTLACSRDLLDRKIIYRLRAEHLQKEYDNTLEVLNKKNNISIKSKMIKKQLELRRKIRKANEAVILLDDTHKKYYPEQYEKEKNKENKEMD